MAGKPVLQALLLADQIYTDSHSGKNVIAGTFNRIWSSEFPGEFRLTYAFVSLVEIRSPTTIELQYRRLDTNEVLLTCRDIPVRAKDPLVTAEFIVQVPPLPMPAPGAYSFDVIHQDEILGSLRITVQKQEERARE